MPTPTWTERLLNTAAQRGRKALQTLPLLARVAAGDLLLPEAAINAALAHAGLDAELPMHWSTLRLRLHDGYFEFDVQGAVKVLRGPTFRLQARFESVEISLSKQTIRLRFLREVQTFARGTVEQLSLVLVRALFASLLEPQHLLKTLQNTHAAFHQEAPDLLRIELHQLEPVQKHLDGNLLGAAGLLLGKDTLLIRGVECREGLLIVQTTTVAREVSRKALHLGQAANGAAGRAVQSLQETGRAWASKLHNKDE